MEAPSERTGKGGNRFWAGAPASARLRRAQPDGDPQGPDEEGAATRAPPPGPQNVKRVMKRPSPAPPLVPSPVNEPV